MTDELVERLRDRGVLPQPCPYHDKAMNEAAARIEQLTAENEKLREALEAIVPVIESAPEDCMGKMEQPDLGVFYYFRDEWLAIASAALGEQQ